MRQRGFTLIELIAAFALMALALTLCLSVASRAYRQEAWSDANARAVLWAQSLADEARATPLQVGVQEGETPDHAFRWRREITPWSDPSGVVVDRGNTPLLLQVRTQLSWDDGGATRSFAMQSLQLAPAKSPAVAP